MAASSAPSALYVQFTSIMSAKDILLFERLLEALPSTDVWLKGMSVFCTNGILAYADMQGLSTLRDNTAIRIKNIIGM